LGSMNSLCRVRVSFGVLGPACVASVAVLRTMAKDPCVGVETLNNTNATDGIPGHFATLNASPDSAFERFVSLPSYTHGHAKAGLAAFAKTTKRAVLPPHGPRRSVGSRAAMTGPRPAIIEKALGHRSAASRKVYMAADRSPARSGATHE